MSSPRPSLLKLAARKPVALVLALLVAAGSSVAADEEARLALVKKLYSEKDWDEAAKLASGPPDQPLALDYYRGMALARLERWQEARDAFSSGARKAPGDARFPTERAGAEYKLGDFAGAKKDLRRALRLAPDDPYIPEFLGTIYLLEDNLEAALKYWNRIEKPRLAAVALPPAPKTSKILVDRAVRIAPPQTLERSALLITDALLENLGVFPRRRAQLAPAGDDGGYQATLEWTERSGWGRTPVDGALTLLRGLPYETVFPSWYGIRRRAVNLDSLLRWDAEKRRFAGNLDFPLFAQPARRVRFFFDARNEHWNLERSFLSGAAPGDLRMKRFAGGAELDFVRSAFWDFRAGVQAVSREFRNVPAGLPAGAAPFFTDSRSVDAWLGVRRWLVRVPERRFTLEGTGEIRGGRSYAGGLGAFASLAGGLNARWLPKARGDDLALGSRVRAGDTFGDVPLDFLNELGVERDNDLWMRGHDATIDGRKGGAPLGRRYFLWNSEIDKNVYDGGFLRVQLGPFFDTGAVADPSGLFGSQKWLFDAGVQAKVRVLGSVSLVLSYGRDLRNGKGLLFATSER